MRCGRRGRAASKYFVDAEYVVFGIEKNGLVPVVVRLIRLLDEPRAVADCKWRHAVDLGRIVAVEVEEEFDAGRVGIVRQLKKPLALPILEPHAALTGT